MIDLFPQYGFKQGGQTVEGLRSGLIMKKAPTPAQNEMARKQMVTKTNEYLELGLSYITTGDFLADMAGAAMKLIVDRTVAGKDANGQRFKAYSEAYKRRKQKKFGRYRGRADLYLFGQMLNGMESVINTPLKGVIRMSPGGHHSGLTLRQIAGIHDEGVSGLMPKRNFMGWRDGSPEDIKLKLIAVKLIQESMREFIAKQGQFTGSKPRFKKQTVVNRKQLV